MPLRKTIAIKPVRKTGLIILTFLYLAFTAGVSIQRHYCMNRLATLRFSVHAEDRCGFCGMEKSERDNSCCRDEQAIYKITDDQEPGLQTTLHTPVLSDFISFHALPVTRISSYNAMDNRVYSHGPPGLSSFPLFIRFGVFRI